MRNQLYNKFDERVKRFGDEAMIIIEREDRKDVMERWKENI